MNLGSGGAHLTGEVPVVIVVIMAPHEYSVNKIVDIESELK